MLAFAGSQWILGEYERLIDALKQDMHIGSIVRQTTEYHCIANDAARPDIGHKWIVRNAWRKRNAYQYNLLLIISWALPFNISGLAYA